MTKNAPIPFQVHNPAGLHQRYYVAKITGTEAFIRPPRGGAFNAREWVRIGVGDHVPPHTPLRPIYGPVDDGAEYFVLRLDEGGSYEHVKACRVAVLAYAAAIEHLCPQLAKDLRERYTPLK